MVRLKAARECVGDFVLTRSRVRCGRVLYAVMALTAMGVAVEVLVIMAPSHSKNGRLMFFMLVKYVAVESEALDVVGRGRTLEPAGDEARVRPREPALSDSRN